MDSSDLITLLPAAPACNEGDRPSHPDAGLEIGRPPATRLRDDYESLSQLLEWQFGLCQRMLREHDCARFKNLLESIAVASASGAHKLKEFIQRDSSLLPQPLAESVEPAGFGLESGPAGPYLFSARTALPLPVRNERGEGRGENSPKPIARLEPMNHPLTRPSGTLSPTGGEGWGEGAVHGEGSPTANVPMLL